jgi:aminoglycoside phosphotransferase (APT) family kinase protein
VKEEPAALAALASRIEPGSRLGGTWALKGGVSAEVTAFEIERADGSRETLIARRHGAAERRRNPQIAADQFRLLQALCSAGIPAPRPRLLDGDILVVEYVVGERPEGHELDLVDQLAAVLAEIHRVPTAALSFLPTRELSELESRNGPVLLHGDFWPGNTLWRGGRLVAVIDWEDAAIGDPLADIANARLELLWASGIEAMDEFTRRCASIDVTDLPHWDLWADRRLTPRIGEWGLDPATEEAMLAGREAFVAQARTALAALSARPRNDQFSGEFRN